MKNFTLIILSFLFLNTLFSQKALIPFNNNGKEIEIGISNTDVMPNYNQPATKNWISRWYNYGETMELYLGVVSPWYGNFLFPDSTILVNYTSGYSSAWLHKIADVLDVTSVMFNDPAIHPNALTIDATTKYKLDSIHFHCKYDRNIADPNIVDTLLFEISVNDNLLQAYFSPGILSPNLSTDTVFMKRLPYNYQTNALTLNNKKIIKVPLTALTYADSLSNGIHIIKVATDSIPKINPGKNVVVAITFIPGYTWVPNTDILDNKNNVLFVSRKERDNYFPHYTKKDFNVSYVLPTDVRYNFAGSWNANFIPSFAYMGTTPTYNYEHHMIYYNISTAFKITYETQHVNCYGGNDGAVTLNITGGTTPYNFKWSNGATTQNVSNLTAGTYTVTITDQVPDTTIRVFNITQPTALAAQVSSTPASGCGVSDGAITVSGIQGGTPSYSIVVLDADSVTQTMTDLIAGIYTVKVTDSHGCKLIKNVAINETGSPNHTINQNNVSCFGLNDGSISISVTNPTGTPVYNWSNGQSGTSISNLSPGNYMLTVTDNNCHIYESLYITQPQALSISGNITNATGGQSNGSIIIQVTGGTPPYTYAWSSGQQTQNLGNLSQGNYTVTVTDSHQCTIEETFNVIQTGINNSDIDFNVEIFPNPAQDVIFLSVSTLKPHHAEVNIYTIHGQLLKKEKIFIDKDSFFSLNITNFTAAMYYMEVCIDGHKINKTFIKN